MTELIDILQYPFMQRAFVAGILLSISLGLIGVFVVLKKMSFFASGIAHASLAGVAIGIITSYNPLFTALITSIIFSSVLFWLEHKHKIASDTLIGIMFTAGMALGVTLISTQPGYQPSLISFLFGNILAINISELITTVVLLLAITIVVFWKKKQLTLIALDPELAHVSGVNTTKMQWLLYLMLTIVVVLSIKILGIVLVSALLIIPVATSKLLASSFRQMMFLSTTFGLISVIVGIILSYLIDLPTGPMIVLVATTLFFLIATTKRRYV
ncbi:MAG: metal ABC transporter permease [Patescibacteria group bacterium]